jgi:aldehyde dehydrogenase (NAD+)
MTVDQPRISAQMNLACYLAGQPLTSGRPLVIRNPYSGETVGQVLMASRTDTEAAIQQALDAPRNLSRLERHNILDRARQLLASRFEDFASLITAESGLCLRETRYEVGRALDVLRFAAMESLRDDGQTFAADVSPNGRPRKIFTTREPVACAAAITPFNHPLNQVAHKLAPAIAAGTPLILKPSEKTPLTALRFAALLHEAGLPGPMLSVLVGPTSEIAELLVRDPRVEDVCFTGSVTVGKRLPALAGYKRLVLELGGNDPLIILDDADLELAVHLAAEGSYRNSGQRCTAVKRILVHDQLADAFLPRLADKTTEYHCGDPSDPTTRVGTVIDESAATQLMAVLHDATIAGARVLTGGKRRGALFEPTLVAEVPRHCRLIREETFGPIAPVLRVRDIDDAIALANDTPYGLSAGVVTQRLDHALECVKRLRCGTVNINEVPGFRTENSPFGGVKDSGLGVKEGVIESIRNFSTVKTFSLPW